ncbi:MAG TPA: hypothetical protein VIX63_10665 [Vicinamibacterales bacterium]
MRTFTLLALSLWASPTFAQVYIGGAVGLDTTLVTSFESAGALQPDRGGTTPALAVRAGIALGQRWGAEVEVAHAFTIERSDTSDGSILAAGARAPVRITWTSVGDFGIDAFPPIRFAPTFHIESEQQLTAVNALAWVSYAMSSRIDLVLAAGAAFNRTSVEQRVRFEPVLLPGFPAGLPIDLFAPSMRVVNYGVGPVVGVETRIGLGDHLRVVPALRMSTAFSGWSVRPTVGVAWMF